MIQTARRMIAAMSLMEAMVAVTVMSTAAIMYANAWKQHGGFSDAAREVELATEIYLREVELLRSKSPFDGIVNGNARPPFTENCFAKPTPAQNAFCPNGGCPPRAQAAQTPGGSIVGETYYAGQDATHQLSWNNYYNRMLTATNAFQIGVDATPLPSWNPSLPVVTDPSTGTRISGLGLPVSQGGMGFSVQVFVSRIHDIASGVTIATLNSDASHLHQLLKYRVVVLRTDASGNTRHVMSGEFLQEVR